MAAKNESNAGKIAAAGAGIVALSAAAYLIFGPEGKKHRKDLKSWMVKMKAEVMEKMEQALSTRPSSTRSATSTRASAESTPPLSQRKPDFSRSTGR